MSGDVRLICGDALEVLPTLGGVDAIVTDPPFGLGNTAARARPPKYQRRRGVVAREWDKEPVDFLGLLPAANVLVIWGGNYYPLPPSRGWLVWCKPDAPPSMASVELAWTNQDMNSRQIIQSIAATNAERCGHPTQKPLRVMRWCMEQAGIPRGATVLDPFMGSGTTGVACVQTGRRFIGIEIDPAYYAIAERRIRECEGRGGLFDPATLKAGE